MVIDPKGSNEAAAGEIFLDKPWITIRWDDAHRCLQSEWKAFATSVEFRAALTAVVAAIRNKKALVYVSDARRLKVIIRKDQEWAHSVWAPLAVEAGLKRLAFVTAESGMGKTAVDDLILMEKDARLLVHAFDSVAAAQNWIAEAR